MATSVLSNLHRESFCHQCYHQCMILYGHNKLLLVMIMTFERFVALLFHSFFNIPGACGWSVFQFFVFLQYNQTCVNTRSIRYSQLTTTCWLLQIDNFNASLLKDQLTNATCASFVLATAQVQSSLLPGQALFSRLYPVNFSVLINSTQQKLILLG